MSVVLNPSATSSTVNQPIPKKRIVGPHLKVPRQSVKGRPVKITKGTK